MIRDWVDRELAPPLCNEGFEQHGIGFVRRVESAIHVVQVMGLGTGKRARAHLICGVQSARLAGADAARGVVHADPPGWQDTHVCWQPGARGINRPGATWSMGPAFASDAERAGDRVRDWMRQHGLALLERFSDDRAILDAYLEDDQDQWRDGSAPFDLRVLLGRFGPQRLIPMMDEEIERQAQRQLGNWRHAAATSLDIEGQLGWHPTTIHGVPIPSEGIDEVVADELSRLHTMRFPSLSYVGPETRALSVR